MPGIASVSTLIEKSLLFNMIPTTDSPIFSVNSKTVAFWG